MTVATRPPEVEQAIARLTAARTRGVDWLVSRVADDGEPIGARTENSYYRLPWALALAGRMAEGAAVMSWVEENALTPSGDLRPGAPQTNWNKVAWTRDGASYPLAILAIGAWHLERYDTALAIMDTLQAFQHPTTGGGFLERPEYRTSGVQDLITTSQLGLAALTTGRREVADASFRWVERLFAAQPELPQRLYLCWDDGGLVTQGSPETASGRYIDFQKPRQAFFNPGIGAAFLARYFMETGAEPARRIGRALIRLHDGATDLQYDYLDTVHIGKFGWGSSAMLDIEPDEGHLRKVLRMAKWYADSQLDDGRWNPTAFLVPEPKDPDALWKTAEHIVLITMSLMALAAYPRPTPRAAS